MDYKEMNECLETLDRAMYGLESTYVDNGGEITEETERMEGEIEALQQLLCTEGIDLLGGWLKAKEDKKKALKAEKDYITRQMSAIDETMDLIKAKVNHILVSTGRDKVKGDRGYSFAATTSTKTEVNKDTLKALYSEKVELAIREANIPAYIGVTLTASSTKAAEEGIAEGDEGIFIITSRPSVRFTKPRASKEE